MKSRIRFARGAREDLREGADWYNRRQAGLGLALRLEVRETLLRILENPGIYQKVDDVPIEIGARSCNLHRFSFYSIIFVDRGSYIRVLAVKHQRQKPDYWLTRH